MTTLEHSLYPQSTNNQDQRAQLAAPLISADQQGGNICTVPRESRVECENSPPTHVVTRD